MLSRRLLPLQFGLVLQWLILWVPVEKLLPKTEQGATDCWWSRSKSRRIARLAGRSCGLLPFDGARAHSDQSGTSSIQL
jgi:hypothetical protein